MSQTTVVLTTLVGNVVVLFFTVRPVDFLVQDNAYQFTAISKFAILDSTSLNCVGGQPILSTLALNYLDFFIQDLVIVQKQQQVMTLLELL